MSSVGYTLNQGLSEWIFSVVWEFEENYLKWKDFTSNFIFKLYRISSGRNIYIYCTALKVFPIAVVVSKLPIEVVEI